jgi:ABC-2 type transport system permease protein
MMMRIALHERVSVGRLAEGRELLGEAVPRRALRRLIVTEARLAVREPAGMVWGIGLPVLLMVIFGNIPKFAQPESKFGGQTALDVYLPILCSMVLAMLALFAIPIPLATYREQGVLRRMATTPVSPAAVLAAQLVVNLALAVVAIGLILGIGTIAFGLSAPHQPFGFALALALTAVALFSLGLWVAAIARTGKAAQALAGACFFPLEFLAGLWVPRQVMPSG